MKVSEMKTTSAIAGDPAPAREEEPPERRSASSVALTDEKISAFERQLEEDEKSARTRDKYTHELHALQHYLGGRDLTKENALAYKQNLIDRGLSPRTINVTLAAVNCYFEFMGRPDLRLRSVKVQKQIFCSEDEELSRDEYVRLCRAAMAKGNEQLALIFQTIGGTGIRVGELPFITAEAVREGKTIVQNKGKARTIFIVKPLQKKLLRFIEKAKIESGPIFLTRGGNPIDRSSVWREMKGICEKAGVNPAKVYPHNLRHLFARVFYAREKDLAGLADILGHSSIDTTRIYIVSTGEEHLRRMEKMRMIL